MKAKKLEYSDYVMNAQKEYVVMWSKGEETGRFDKTPAHGVNFYVDLLLARGEVDYITILPAKND